MTKLRTKGNVIVQDIKVGDIHYDFEYGAYIEMRVIKAPEKVSDHLWQWEVEDTETGTRCLYSLSESCPSYLAPNLYNYIAYDNFKRIYIKNTSVIPNNEGKVVVVEGGKEPWKARESDSCWDLSARKIERISDHETKVYLGVHIEPPAGYDVRLYVRSSFGKHSWILGNHIGIGDEDYRGEYIAIFNPIPIRASGNRFEWKAPIFPYQIGDRCIQFEFQKKENIGLRIVDSLSATERGKKGFGSSGN